ncbi:hypothetical protein [Aeromonas caviae]|uniref:hypothetical protein n=1 Tax=Aeromonas caviae TaxID=648 RepID=UPI003F748B55
MMPEPWSIDDLSDEEYAAWEAEQEAEWLANPEREFWEEMRAMVADNLVIPDWWDDDSPDWAAIALWRAEKGVQPSPRDVAAMARVTRAHLAGEVQKKARGRKPVKVTPRIERKRQLRARYLLDQRVARKVIAAGMPGVHEGQITALAEAGGHLQFGVGSASHLDDELMQEIAREFRGEEKRAAMMGTPIRKGGR